VEGIASGSCFAHAASLCGVLMRKASGHKHHVPAANQVQLIIHRSRAHDLSLGCGCLGGEEGGCDQ
jgi:hypothetical protein